MTKILGISGKKQSGKDTAANYILGSLMKKLEYINGFKITQQGKLYVYGWTDGFAQDCIVDYDDNTWPMSSLKKNYLDKYIKLYSFADCLKQQICIKMLGLTYEQCYGTDEQKNSLTHLKWEDMPGVISFNEFKSYSGYETSGGSSILGWVEFDKTAPLSNAGYGSDWCGYVDEKIETDPKLFNDKKWIGGLIIHESGFMTARQVLQFCGTEVMRQMYGNAHVNATMNQIKQDAPEYAIIRDTRFINEVEGVQENGIVVRLLRDVFAGKDQHESETALDNYPVDKFDFVVDNKDMAIIDQNQKVYEFLKTQGWNI